MAEVPMLTPALAERANYYYKGLDARDNAIRAGLGAIATGRTKTVAVRSEAEWREEFECLWYSGHFCPMAESDWQRRGFLSALRSLGLVSGKQGGG